MSLNLQEIHDFIQKLSDSDRIYVVKTIEISDSIRRYINIKQLSDKQASKAFKVPAYLLKSFVSGDYEYDLKDISTLNALYDELDRERLKERHEKRYGAQKK